MTFIVWFSVLALFLFVVPYLYWSWREQSARPGWLRASFWGGLALFMALFVALTWHTLSVMPQRTRAHNIDAQVIAGKEAWQKNVCVNCHTILGNGAYYGPDLTRAWNRFVERAGGDERAAKAALTAFLSNPPAPTPDRRGMVKPAVAAGEAESLAAFLRWVAEIDTSGWPPAPSRPIPRAVAAAPGAALSAEAEAGKRLLGEHGCVGCHSVGEGVVIGPDLAQAAEKYPAEVLRLWITDTEQAYQRLGRRPSNGGFAEMPGVPVPPQDAEPILAYLNSVRERR